MQTSLLMAKPKSRALSASSSGSVPLVYMSLPCGQPQSFLKMPTRTTLPLPLPSPMGGSRILHLHHHLPNQAHGTLTSRTAASKNHCITMSPPSEPFGSCDTLTAYPTRPPPHPPLINHYSHDASTTGTSPQPCQATPLSPPPSHHHFHSNGLPGQPSKP